MIHLNAIRVLVHPNGIPAWRSAQAPVHTHHDLHWEYGGRHYSLTAQPEPGWEPIRILPLEAPDIYAPVILKLLIRSLDAQWMALEVAGCGMASEPENGIPFRFHVRVLAPGDVPDFYLILSPEGASSPQDLRHRVQALAAALSPVILSTAGETWLSLEPLRKLDFTRIQENAPRFNFHPAGYNSHPNKLKGLREHGPLSSRIPPQPPVHILPLIPAKDGRRHEALLGDFLKGMPSVFIKGAQPWKQGLKESFRLDAFTLSNPVEKEDTARMQQEIRNIREQVPDVRIVVLFAGDEEAEQELCRNILQQDVPYHILPAELLLADPAARATAMFPQAIRLFCKTGGIPWQTGVESLLMHEIVIGIGLQHGAQDKTIAYSTFFSRDGVFTGSHSEYTSRTAAGQDWSWITHRICAIARAANWQQGDSVRLIFHLHGATPAHTLREIQQETMLYLQAEYRLHIAFLEVRDQHEYLAWTEPFSLRGDQACLIPGGSLVYLSTTEALLQPFHDKIPDTYATQFYLRLLPDSGYTDFESLVSQAMMFTYISPYESQQTRLPATLIYNQLILKRLSLILSPSQHVVPASLSSIPWFL